MIHQAKPGAMSDLLPVYVKQLVKIMTKAQTEAGLPRSLIAFENKGGEQTSRAVFDR
jgi:hypothetical protein